jgi:multidrug resistance protein
MANQIDSYQENSHTTERTPLLSTFKDPQSHILPPKKLLIVFSALALVQFTSFLDQTSTSTALPAIAAGLNTGSSISWVGASFLVSSTSIQLINGRLSDIFGRKACLITSLILMGLGNLLSGFSRTPTELYATRALSGFGAGAINALVQITISDITTLEQRGKYFGIIGVFVALGNGLGPLIGGALTEKTSWRWAFWFISPMTAVAVIIIVLVLPQSGSTGDIWTKLKLIDWLGVIVSMAAVILILAGLPSPRTDVLLTYHLTGSNIARWLYIRMELPRYRHNVDDRPCALGCIPDHRMAFRKTAHSSK